MNTQPTGHENQIYDEEVKTHKEKDTLLVQEKNRNNKKKFFDWLDKNLKIVNLNSSVAPEEITQKLNNHQSVIDAFERIYDQISDLEKQIEQLKAEKHSTLPQTITPDLEVENREIESQARSLLLKKLDEENRDKAVTITSDDSLRQRDSLTQDFIRLNTQDFTAVSNELFNYRCQINSDLKSDRKAEIARIKSLLSKKIFQ